LAEAVEYRAAAILGSIFLSHDDGSDDDDDDDDDLGAWQKH
jgi:hypothetical protein